MFLTDPDGTVTRLEVTEFCGSGWPHKIPRSVRRVGLFPMTVGGKVRKVEMRALAIEELGLTSAASRAQA